SPGKPESARAMLGDQADAVLQNPTRVMIYRVEPGDGDAFHVPNVEGFPTIAETLIREPAQVREVRELILDTGAYDFEEWGQNKWCGAFEPGVAIVFARERAKVIALICFKCNDIVYAVYNQQDQRTFSTFVDFRPGRARFLQLAQQAFPDDATLQALTPD
ncbi:MAG TPA: hypothetical protein PKB10_13890, partial [Tepidisphaeraceae bacterium]|nr:hypothetical protein [Tepidisphaeraceae bacterium]